MAVDGWIPSAEGAVLFWEDVFLDREGPSAMDAALRTLKAVGALDHLAGMLIGRFHPQFLPDDFDVAEHVRRILRPSYPVVADLDFGHTNPIVTLPIGAYVRVDAGAGAADIIQAATVRPSVA